MPVTDYFPGLSSHTADFDLGSFETGSRTCHVVSERRRSHHERFLGKSEAVPRKASNTEGFSLSRSRPRSSHNLLTLSIALLLVHSVLCQNTNPLVPEIVQPDSPQQELTSVTVGCRLILLSDFPASGQFPLSWSRNGGLPSGATTTTSTEIDGTARTYYSALTFTIIAADYNRPITCNAVTPSNRGSTSFTPDVILPPDDPRVTGPATVRAGEVNTWTCQSDGASEVSPNVYWRNGRGEALTNGVVLSTRISVDNFGNRIYSISSTLSTALPPERDEYVLNCILIHESGSYSYQVQGSTTVTVLFPPQLRKASGDIVTTTETVKTTVSCIIASSSPAATSVSWTKDGQPVDFSTGRYEVVSVRSPSLVITSSEMSDAGDYVCTARNVEGETNFTTPTTLLVLYAPRISYPGGTNFQATLGASYTLPCPVDANPNATTIRWKRISQTGVVTYLDINNARYSGSTAQTTGLTINPIEADDQGDYACDADNNVGPGRGPTITLTVNSRPVINPPPASVTGREGNPVSLPCEITSPGSLDSLTWQKDGVDLVVTNSARYTGGTVSNPTLIFLSPTDADSGRYRCVASNQYGTTEGVETTLDIQYEPRLTVATTPISTNPGPSISLTCQVDANPAPSTLFWTKRGAGAIVSTGSNKYIGGTPSNPTLTITTTEIADGGEYYCTANNSIGTRESSAVVLRVITIPDVNISPPSAMVAEGTPSLVLGCTVVASPPATQVDWTKDGNIIDTTSGTTTSGSGPKYVGGTTQTPSLTINDVRRTDAGVYACVATNSEGVGPSPNLRVDVTYVPTLTVPTDTVTGARGASLTLTCGVEAFPPLTSIRWVKDGSGDVDLLQRTGSGQNKYSGGTLVTPDLTIFDLDETTDTGVYRCVAENARGPATSGPVNAAVTFDPVINVPTSVTAKEGDSSFTISCNIQMYPPATSLTWYKDNSVFDPAASPNKYLGGTLASPTLTVLNPAGSDSGTYKCQASNGQGVDITSSDIPVSVTFPPKITASTAQVTRDRGQSVTLQVSVDAIPTASSVQWQTSDIDSGSSVRTDVSLGGRISGGSVANPSLTISGLQPSDADFYYITVTNDEGSTSVGPIPLRVRYQPSNLQVTASPSLLQTGNSLTLTCSAEAWPDITSYQWTRDGSVGTVLATGPVYTKTQVGTEDWADFRCSVTNAVGTQAATVRPNIQFVPVQNNPGVVVESVPVGGSVTLTCDITANPTPTYTWYNGPNVIAGAVDRTYTLQANSETDFGDYSCSAENTIGTLNPAVEFTVQEGEPDVGASIGGDGGLSTATIILIIIIVIIFLIILVLIIIFCCMQGTCAKWCRKETPKVAPTTYTPPQPAPVYMNGGLVGSKAEPTTKVMVDDDEPTDVEKQFKPLNPGAIIPDNSWIISVPEGQGPRAHYLPPLGIENEHVDNYYREEKRRSRKKRKQRRHRQADDKDALTEGDGGQGGSPDHAQGNGDVTTPGRSGDLESRRIHSKASPNVYQNPYEN